MASLSGFNAEEHKPLDQYDPIPPDKYEAVIVDSERKQTKDGSGEYLKLTWQVISGAYEGRKVFDNVNLVNKSSQAVEIGMRQLSTICRAVGKMRVDDSQELHDVPCVIDVKIRPAKGDYAASNDIKGYEAIGAASAPSAPAPAAPAPKPSAWKGGSVAPAALAAAGATAVGGGGKPPWVRK